MGCPDGHGVTYAACTWRGMCWDFRNIRAPLLGGSPVVCSEGTGVQFISTVRMLKAAFVTDACPKGP